MALKDILEPIIITYNRYEGLKQTLEQLAAENSPLKDCEIKILDNCSTDGTKEFCEKFCNNYPNFKYIRHSKNIGLSGNVIEAMRIASKKWLWILCDDDYFHWRGWEEIEEALQEDYDIVLNRQNIVGVDDIPHYINDCAFLPNVIWNTKHITDITLQNAYGIAHTLCPHQAITTKVINENGKIFLPKKTKDILDPGNNNVTTKGWFRVPQQNLYYKFSNYNILLGYMNAYKLLQDENLRQDCLNIMCQGLSFKKSMELFLKLNNTADISYIFEALTTIDKKKADDLISVIVKNNSELKRKYLKFIFMNINYIIKNSILACFERIQNVFRLNISKKEGENNEH